MKSANSSIYLSRNIALFELLFDVYVLNKLKYTML